MKFVSCILGIALVAVGVTAAQNTPAPPAAASGLVATDVGRVDLGPAFENMQGKHLRMRTVTFAPGTRSPEHSHRGRPGMAYVLQGTFTEHRNGITKEYGPGTSWTEDNETTHWVENRGSVPAIQLSVVIEAQP